MSLTGPTLTPTSGNVDLAVYGWINQDTITAGSATGFTYVKGTISFYVAWAIGVSTAVSPSVTASPNAPASVGLLLVP